MVVSYAELWASRGTAGSALTLSPAAFSAMVKSKWQKINEEGGIHREFEVGDAFGW